MTIEYRHNTASQTDILCHLKHVAPYFVVDLATRVNLDEYAQKLYSHAELEEAWHDCDLIGLVAYYNNATTKESFVSNVSVDIKFQKQGIASALLNQARTNSLEHSMKSMRVEVANDVNLISYYQRHGFMLQADQQSSNIKTLILFHPLVVIRCTVYNHEPYLRDCMEGFVTQQTTFPYIVIVHDDKSTDKSATIIREYVEKYPAIFQPIYETENQYSKHDGSLQRIMNNAIDATGAKYVAMCEGDDYWTDPYKLQNQVDILEADETLMACCTNCSVVDNYNKMIHPIRPETVVKDNIGGRYTLRDFFRDNHQYPTASVVYRNTHVAEIRTKHQHTENAFLGDWTFWICLLIYGDMYYFDEVTCAYRINPTSVTHTVNRVARAKASREICQKVADILPAEYTDIAEDLRDTSWVWISLIFAYKAEKRYFGMLGSIFICLIKCPGSLWRTIKKKFM